MKKLIAFGLALFQCILLAVPASAAGAPKVSAGTVEAVPGSEVRVPLTMTGNSGLAALYLTVNYDHRAMELTEVQFDPDFCTDGLDWTAANLRDGILNFVRVRGNNTSNGTAATLVFRLFDRTEPGRYPVTLTYDRENTFDAQFHPKLLSTGAGAVIVRPGMQVGASEGQDGLDLGVQIKGECGLSGPLTLVAAAYRPDGQMTACEMLPCTEGELSEQEKHLHLDGVRSGNRWQVFLLDENGRPVLKHIGGTVCPLQDHMKQTKPRSCMGAGLVLYDWHHFFRFP